MTNTQTKIPKEISNDKLLEIVAEYYNCEPKCFSTVLDERRNCFYVEYHKDGFEDE